MTFLVEAMHNGRAGCRGTVDKITTKTAGDKKLLFETLSAFEKVIIILVFLSVSFNNVC